ncbi:conserved exported protein of unknown function [Nitrospira defluvii]|jgi:hypothetical protein|uniref:Uncharacterized protein n=1 Tax=Nitrospira defluvii TaxID=330214 RepID=D8PJ55_9BACT|nr:conserved exported protein of unknown function [Nitrospira defluvii]
MVEPPLMNQQRRSDSVRRTIHARGRISLVGLLAVLSLAGCLSPPTLNRAVLAYDEAITDAISKQLLINIARAHHHEPIHFTGVANVAATFDFRINAGATPALTGEHGRTLVPLFGGSIAENPTISITPIEGEEFTKRILAPFQESKLNLLLRQGVDIDLLLRLMAKELRLKRKGEEVAYRNSPSDKDGYDMFRKVVLHLSAIQDANHLYAEALTFERTWTIPAESVTAEGFATLEQQYLITYQSETRTYTLRKPVSGRILITNYDPATLPPAERVRLHETADQRPVNDVSFDIRAGHFGGEWPLQGDFRLRSFNAMLNFLGHAADEDREYAVDKDSRTPPVAENPVHTMDLLILDHTPDEPDLAVKSHGRYYAINATGPQARWNREAFKLLSQLFQMTVTDVPRTGVPSITIAK